MTTAPAAETGTGTAELSYLPGCAGRGPWWQQVTMAVLPSTVPRARAILRQLLHDWQLEILSDTTTLLMSELVTNAVQASGNGSCGDQPGRQVIVATVRLTDMSLLLEVWDANPAPPVLQDVDLTSECGRGLFMIECLSDKWGYYAADGGKVVWCEVACPVATMRACFKGV